MESEARVFISLPSRAVPCCPKQGAGGPTGVEICGANVRRWLQRKGGQEEGNERRSAAVALARDIYQLSGEVSRDADVPRASPSTNTSHQLLRSTSTSSDIARLRPAAYCYIASTSLLLAPLPPGTRRLADLGPHPPQAAGANPRPPRALPLKMTCPAIAQTACFRPQAAVASRRSGLRIPSMCKTGFAAVLLLAIGLLPANAKGGRGRGVHLIILASARLGALCGGALAAVQPMCCCPAAPRSTAGRAPAAQRSRRPCATMRSRVLLLPGCRRCYLPGCVGLCGTACSKCRPGCCNTTARTCNAPHCIGTNMARPQPPTAPTEPAVPPPQRARSLRSLAKAA